MIRVVLALYPRAWRRRYGAEILAHFCDERLTSRDLLDLLAGAVDAHLHPQWAKRRRRRPVPTVALLSALTLLLGAAARAPAVVAVGGLIAVLGLLLLLARRRMRRGPGWWPGPEDPAAGAGVPRHPYDPEPEPLMAAGQVRR